MTTMHGAVDEGFLPPERCPTCHALRSWSGDGCLACHLKMGLDDEPEVASLDFSDLPDGDWRLGGYELLEEIGRGGMGVIYRARQPNSNRLVALKRILPQFGHSRETVARLRREAETVAQLDHPHILPIYEVGAGADGLPFFSMKLAGGGNLAQARPRLRGKAREVVGLMLKIARAMQHAHQQSIFHRDLKPANVLLDGHGEPLVADFGLAKWLDHPAELTQTMTTFGTPGYMAPEQALGSAGSVGAAADIYSLGAMLFDLLAGDSPFTGENALSVVRQASEVEAPALRSRLPGADRDLETICARCLQREPQSRYRSAGDLADDLQCWLDGRPIHARPVSLPERSWRWINRNRVLTGAAAACVVLTSGLSWREIESARLEKIVDAASVARLSVAMLPMEDLDALNGESPQTADWAAILADVLAGLKPLRMQLVAREAAEDMQLAKIHDLRDAGDKLGVRAVLASTVRRVGKKTHLVLRLVDTSTGMVLWRWVEETAAPRSTAQAPDIRATALRNSLLEALNPPTGQTPQSYRKIVGSEMDPTAASKVTLARDYLIAGRELFSKRGAENLTMALSCYRKAVLADPQCGLAHALLAFSLASLNQYKHDDASLAEAEKAARTAIELDAMLPDAWRALAVCDYIRGRLAEATEAATAAYELDPGYQRAAGLSGAIWLLRGRPDLALNWYRKAAAMADQPGEYDFDLGCCWTDLGQIAEARRAFVRGVEFRPELSDPHAGLIRLSLLTGEMNVALRDGQALVKKHPADAFALQAVAQTSFFRRDYRQAEKDYQALVKLDPTGGGFDSAGIRYHAGLGFAILQSGRVADGISLLQEAERQEMAALQAGSTAPVVFYSLAAIQAALGNRQAALDRLRQAAQSGWLDSQSPQLDPRFEKLWSDADFQQILTLMQLRVAELNRKLSAG